MQRNQACFGSYDCLKNQASEAAEVWWLGFKKSLDKILWAKLLNHMDWNVMHSGMAPLLQAHAWRSLQHSQGQSSCHLPTQQSSHAVETSVADTYSTSSTRMIIRNVSDMHCICICRPATSVIVKSCYVSVFCESRPLVKTRLLEASKKRMLVLVVLTSQKLVILFWNSLPGCPDLLADHIWPDTAQKNFWESGT